MPVFFGRGVGKRVLKNVLYGEALPRRPTPYLLYTTENQIISQCKIKLSQKNTTRVYIYGWKFSRPPLLIWLGIIFLDYYILLCNIQIDTFAGMDTDQCRSSTLPELWYKIACNSIAFFLNWKQRTAVKAVEDALQGIKMYIAGVWAKFPKGCSVEEQVIRLQRKTWINS